MRWFSVFIPLSACLVLNVISLPSSVSGQDSDTADQTRSASTKLFWGDTHLHTSYSFDVYLFGTPNATPDAAYRFAKGLPVVSATTGTRWQLKKPLDFLVVADHAEMLGSMRRLYDGDDEIAGTQSGKAILAISENQTEEELQKVYDELTLLGSGMESSLPITVHRAVADLHAGTKRKTAWEETIDAAEEHNEPGKFTAFIGWEWTSQPGGSNLHRVIFMPNDGDVARKFIPYSALESFDPQDLWAWLEKTSDATGAEFVAIPHNPNISIGKMFPVETMSGDPVGEDYAKARRKWEPVIEVTQIKGDSEAHPLLSPTDEFADFETYPFVITPEGKTPDPTEGDYVRSGLKRGLAIEKRIGVNPYKVGMIGSTDSHTGISAVEEDNFAGKGQHDATPCQRPHLTGLGAARGWDMGAAGFAGVWATENSRQALVDAFKRKEVYATTGPRMSIRFFGGFEFTQEDADSDIANVGYAKGVPMGGDLTRNSVPPSFLVSAMKDPDEGNLDRIQIIKGWVDADGETQEKVYDVVWSDTKKRGVGADGKLPPVGNSVNLQTGEYTNSIGATNLTGVWKDPDFDSSVSAFYYARVLQIPTPRHSLLDSIALGTDVEETGHPATIQERAYTSPIWYTPK